jgi:hypothetical protein
MLSVSQHINITLIQMMKNSTSSRVQNAFKQESDFLKHLEDSGILAETLRFLECSKQVSLQTEEKTRGGINNETVRAVVCSSCC